MAIKEYQVNSTITPTKSMSTSRTFLPPELYLPEWARDTEFFRCMTILLDYVQNSLKDISNPKYAMIEQAYKDIGFKYKDILQTSEECLKAMLAENGFGKILEIFKLSLEQLQMITLYLPLLKIMKGTDEGYRLFLSLFASDFEIETWLDNPQELEEYTFNILFVSWVNVGLSSDFVNNFIEFSRTYVYPILKNVEMGITYKYLSPFVYGYPKLQMAVNATFNGEAVIVDWSQAQQNTNLGNNGWHSLAYGNNKFVAFGDSQYTSVSSDGISWSQAQQNSNLNYLQSLCYGNNKFVAIGSSGYVSTSSDGINWPQAQQNADLGDNNWRSLTYGNGKFIALGQYGYISTSLDGINWSEAQQNTNLGNNGWTAVTYGNGKFIALGVFGHISISFDGVNWSQAQQNTNLGNNVWYAITFNAGNFIALSYTGYASIREEKIE